MDTASMRSRRRSAAGRVNRSVAPQSTEASRTEPVESRSSPIRQLSTVDLPEPDSPISPSASPGATSNETSHAATIAPVNGETAVPKDGPVPATARSPPGPNTLPTLSTFSIQSPPSKGATARTGSGAGEEEPAPVLSDAGFDFIDGGARGGSQASGATARCAAVSESPAEVRAQ